MKFFLAIAIVLAAVVAATEDGKVTCWDICRWKCKARYGSLTEECVKTCGCTCNTECDNFCGQYGLGWSCRFKCGCYQNFTFGTPGKLLLAWTTGIEAAQELVDIAGEEEDIYGEANKKHHKSQLRKKSHEEEEEEVEEEEQKTVKKSKGKKKVEKTEQKVAPAKEETKTEKEAPKEVKETPKEAVPAENLAGKKPETKEEPVIEKVKEAVNEAAACTKDCANKCTEGKDRSVTDVIKCLRDCKCTDKAAEQMVKSNKFFETSI